MTMNEVAECEKRIIEQRYSDFFKNAGYPHHIRKGEKQ